MSGEFSVYWWDAQDGQHTEHRFVDVNQVKSAVQRLTQGPAALLGIVNRVMVTDGGDHCCLDWNKTDGLVFPAPHDWVPSTLGHGNTMCSRCKMTDLEAAALGKSEHCEVRKPTTVVLHG